MGGAMAGTLRRAGFEVRVWNRTAARANAVAEATGATPADAPSGAIDGAEVVISSLADDAAVIDTYLGSVAAASALHPGQIVLEMSTIAPRTLHRILPAVERRGAALLDAPVSGSVPSVEQGTLTILVGGPADVLERARPVIEALAAKVIHVGTLGMGATMKLAVNSLVHAIDVGLSEALVLAERAGVDRTAAYEVFASGAAAAPFVLYKRQAFERPEDAPVAFSLDLMAKDLDLVLDLAAEVGARMDQAEGNRATVRAALAAGFAGRDLSAVAEYLRGEAGDSSGSRPEGQGPAS
jgi:3-hydroxyisobutyrate dehydrogenase-like beta-hydroxyacid dehydrogenase